MASRAREMELEAKAMQEYTDLLGKVVEVRAISGFVGNDSAEFTCVGTKVRICKTSRDDILRWNDGFLDPIYEVEIIERGELYGAAHWANYAPGTTPRSCWIYGVSRDSNSAKITDADIVVQNENGG